jgi:hypothetical protein
VEKIPAAGTSPAESNLFHVFNDPKDNEEALHGRHHLCGAEMLESLQRSSKKCSCKGKVENEDKDLKKPLKNSS